MASTPQKERGYFPTHDKENAIRYPLANGKGMYYMKRDKLAAGVGCANTRNDVDKRTPEPLGGGFRHLVVYCRRGEKYDTYVGRKCAGAPAGCDGGWGNPLQMTRIDSGERARVIASYRAWLADRPGLVARARSELRGKVLACWCAPHDCHGHVLAHVANCDKSELAAALAP